MKATGLPPLSHRGLNLTIYEDVGNTGIVMETETSHAHCTFSHRAPACGVQSDYLTNGSSDKKHGLLLLHLPKASNSCLRGPALDMDKICCAAGRECGLRRGKELRLRGGGGFENTGLLCCRLLCE